MRASPCGQQTAKPPRPRKSRNVGSIPGPVRHFCGVIHAGAWRGSCQPSPDRIIASVLLQPAEPRDAGLIITILFENILFVASVRVCAVLPSFSLCHRLLPSLPRVTLTCSHHLTSRGKSVVNVILCGKCHSDKTERRKAIMASCQAMASRMPTPQSSMSSIPASGAAL